jgi:hypothetical protein
MPPIARTPKFNDLEIIPELNEEEAEDALKVMNENLVNRERDDEEFRDTEVMSRNRAAAKTLTEELNETVLAYKSFDDKTAQEVESLYATDSLLRELRIESTAGYLLFGIKYTPEQLAAHDRLASDRINRGSSNWGAGMKLLISLALFLAFAGIIGYLVASLSLKSSKRNALGAAPNQSSDPDKPLDQTPFGHRMMTLTDMAMEAAADGPNRFQELGITDACYAQLRQTIIDGQCNVPESLWWRLLADQALQPFPQTDILPTPANHYMSLAFCLDFLMPLYPPQPMDLDVDETIDTLASSLNLLDPTCMAGYYSRMLEVIPETSGANRAQRLFLARAGLALAFSRMPA